MIITKKTVTIKLTAAEAEWLWYKLEGVAQQAKESGTPSALKDGFKAESLQDRIASEGA
jgi:hypothetical protein